MSIIDSLNISRKELLDLGLRNPLINHRKSAKQVRIIDEYSSETFRILVNEGKKMSFLALKEGDKRLDNHEIIEGEQSQLMLFLDENGEGEKGESAKRYIDNKLQTSLDQQQLQKKLLSIHRDAKTYIEEQGVSILYLALGFLYWYEDESSDEPRRAPLILVPVELKRSDVKEKFQLEYSGAEISDNLSLQEKLKIEFHVNFPFVNEVEELDINSYYKKALKSINKIERWHIEQNEITLGFFSFGKFLMYKDLDIENWPKGKGPIENKIINALLTDGFETKPSQYKDDVKIDDMISPGDLHLVMDADSSQILTILDINDGRNLVIQGPPGTGKSQTITNIIAEAIGQNKKVLFVSEKMAALEVVKRRLDLVHLGDCALELHSYKTNKKNLLDEINKTINLGRPQAEVKEGNIKILTKYRDKLNAYANAVNNPIGKTSTNFITAIGKSQQIKFSIEAPISFDYANIEKWSFEKYRDVRLLVEKLDNQLKIIGNPSFHPYFGSQLTDFLPDEKSEIIEYIDNSLESLLLLIEKCRPISSQFGVFEANKISDVQLFINTSKAINYVPDDLRKFDLLSNTWKQNVKPYFEAKTFLYKLDLEYEKDWNVDLLLNSNVNELNVRISKYKEKWWKAVSLDFYKSKKELHTFYKHNKLPKDNDLLIDILNEFIIGQKYLKENLKNKENLLSLFQPEISLDNQDWTSVNNSAIWYKEQLDEVEKGNLLKTFPEYLSKNIGKKIKTTLIADLEQSLKNYLEALQKLSDRLILDSDNQIYLFNLKELEFSAQKEKFTNWKSNINLISDWVSYNHVTTEMKHENLGFIIDLTIDWPHEYGFLLSSFDYSWYYGISKKAYKEFPEIKAFNRSDHELTQKNFIDLDKELLIYNQYRLAANHFEKIPQLSNGGGQLRIIQNELNKKRRHMPIRKLIEMTGQVLQVLKPVFMMSPMSIATYLPPGTLEFDLIVFDEASQVKPVDAFGALLRGQQGVVVGDNKQLPPTSFFDSIYADEDEDNYESIGDLESILSLFLAKGANEKMLRWHYRSKHDSLIAVSNNEFYNNKLYIFPSSGINRKAKGLIFNHLPITSYDRGKTRTNPLEAEEIAKAVIRHVEETPELTLGVVAFSVAQRDAIIFHLENLRQKSRVHEHYFMDTTDDGEMKKEPFFVKNLENVQGDERDVILISVGYGKTKDGYFPMSFGPLNKDGGERRLNVLISRARLSMQIFANFKSNDIDLERTNSRGVIALKHFLAYAETGIIDQPYNTGKAPDSAFEEAVLKQLQLHGVDAEPQVGTAGFFIDIGIKHSSNKGEYILGVECDGASYHSSGSSRDRDRLRQEVLESLGWNIYRIWSTDWFKNPDSEFKKLLYAIENAKSLCSDHNGHKKVVENSLKINNIVREKNSKQEYGIEDIKKYPYAKSDLKINLGGYEIYETNSGRISEWINKIVNTESPIHIYVLTQRIIESAGYIKSGSRINKAIESGIRTANYKNQITLKGDFLWKTNQDKVIPRDRSELWNTEKKIEYIAPEEVQAALIMQVTNSFVIEDNEVSILAANMLGFSRVTDKILATIKKEIPVLLRKKTFLRENGLLTINH